MWIRVVAYAAWPIRATPVAHRCLSPVPFAPLSRYRIGVMIDHMTAQSLRYVGRLCERCRAVNWQTRRGTLLRLFDETTQ